MRHLKVQHFSPRLSNPTPCACDFDVYFSPGRFEVSIYLHDPQGKAAPEIHRVLNQFYRRELFKHLLPVSTLQWYYLGPSGKWIKVHLEGLPGGYLSASVQHAEHVLLLPWQNNTDNMQAQ